MIFSFQPIYNNMKGNEDFGARNCSQISLGKYFTIKVDYCILTKPC